MERIYKTQTERIDLLVKRGMTIEESSKKILEKYSHYNLINAYKNPFLENRGNYPAGANINEDYYILGTIPEYFEALYQFDRKLRLIFLEEILIIEEKLKHAIIQSFYDVHTNYGQNKAIAETLHKENEYLRRIYYNRETFSGEEIEEKSNISPNAKTGVAYGLIYSRDSGNIKVVNRDEKENIGNEINFKFYVGNNKRGKFNCILSPNSIYKKFESFGIVKSDIFEFYYSTSPEANTNEMSISETKIKRINLKDEYKLEDRYRIYLKTIGADTLEYSIVEKEEDLEIKKIIEEGTVNLS